MSKPGSGPDELDRLDLYEDKSPDEMENLLRQAHAEARSDPALAELLKSGHYQEDRAEGFASFLGTGIPEAISRLIETFGGTKESAVCDLGCGAGHVAFALHQLGYARMTAIDPIGGWYLGTGYLKSVAGETIDIVNDLEKAKDIVHRFDAVVSAGTIHHWQNIPMVALQTRRMMKPGAHWFALHEFFAETPREFLAAMQSHPTRSRFRTYEWAYPASAYVDLIQSVGFRLVAVIPMYYRSNELLTWRPVPTSGIDVAAINKLVDEKLTGPDGTVKLFWDEVDRNRRQVPGPRIFTWPQAFIFRRIAL